jgi:hypothetical protein
MFSGSALRAAFAPNSEHATQAAITNRLASGRSWTKGIFGFIFVSC